MKRGRERNQRDGALRLRTRARSETTRARVRVRARVAGVVPSTVVASARIVRAARRIPRRMHNNNNNNNRRRVQTVQVGSAQQRTAQVWAARHMT
jgi:hypothetical protein